MILGFLFGGGKQTTRTYSRLGELSNQTAKEASPRPIIWGRVRPIAGNVIHTSPAIKRMVEVGRTTVGGKGGGGGSTTIQYEERVYRSYAIRICEGPISDIVRVWRNEELVYDARGNEWGDDNNEAFTEIATFYLGGWDQLPDPTLESVWGVGEVPAYRGTCYMVVTEDDLTSFGGLVPEYRFEVQRNTNRDYLTSKEYIPEEVTSQPYAIYSLEEISAGGGSVDKGFTIGDRIESFETKGGSVDAGVLDQKGSYSMSNESFETKGGSVEAGVLNQTVIYSSYSIGNESFETKGGDVVSGNLDKVVGYITYSIDPESFETKGGSVDAGVLDSA